MTFEDEDDSAAAAAAATDAIDVSRPVSQTSLFTVRSLGRDDREFP